MNDGFSTASEAGFFRCEFIVIIKVYIRVFTRILCWLKFLIASVREMRDITDGSRLHR